MLTLYTVILNEVKNLLNDNHTINVVYGRLRGDGHESKGSRNDGV